MNDATVSNLNMHGAPVSNIMDSGFVLVVVLAMFAVFFWSWVRILHRMGLSGWWILLMGFWPIMLPILATCRWPALDKKSN
jgi:uncharacterized membrane protein YhaH (DUF805 family)